MDTGQALREGTYLRNNTYRIERILGYGGFGITYLAFDVNLERYVAIKEFFPRDYCNRYGTTSHVTTVITSATDLVEKLRSKFLKEARNIAKLDHPGIIKIFAAFEENNTAYYVMEYIEGCTLENLVYRNGPLYEAQAIDYMNRIGHALQYIHSQHMNHLDIKPSNVMIRATDGQTILIDFGVSKQYDHSGHQTSTSPVGLSHGYSPLEQYQTGGINEFSPRTDLYSLAATLYFLLTGNHPPQAAFLIENDLEFPPYINSVIVNTITRAMSTSRRDRQPDVTAFLTELHNKPNKRMVNPPSSGPTISGATSAKTLVKNVGKNFPSLKGGNSVPKPKSKTKFEPLPASSSNNGNSSKVNKEKNSTLIWAIIGCAAAVIVFVVVLLMVNSKGDSSENKKDLAKIENVENKEVSDMKWNTPYGKSNYTGGVAEDENGEQVPNGIGHFEIIDGESKGAKYDGAFVMGKMEGQGTYTMSFGDIFVGKMKADAFDEGRYTSISSGEYFDGKFKDGEPYDGKWYNKSGKVLETIVAGKSQKQASSKPASNNQTSKATPANEDKQLVSKGAYKLDPKDKMQKSRNSSKESMSRKNGELLSEPMNLSPRKIDRPEKEIGGIKD